MRRTVSTTDLHRSGLSGDTVTDEGAPAPPAARSTAGGAGSVDWVISRHGTLLLLILVALFPLVVVDSVWSADIGARLYQAKTLLETGSWIAVHPLPRVDPDGLYFPLHLSDATDAAFRYVPYPKHPLLVWITAAEYRLATRLPGNADTNVVAAVVGLHTLSTFAAAVATARLVARSRPRLAAPALWFTGLISPLFVDAFVGHAHTPAAALFAWAAILLLEFTEPSPPRTTSDVSRLVAAGVLIALACAIRTEATLLGVAMAAGLVVAGRHRSNRNRWVVAGLVVATTTAAATIADRLMLPDTTGPANLAHGGDPWGGLIGRVEGFQRTVLSPGGSTADLLILAAAVLVLVAGYIVGRGRATVRPEILLVVATTAATVRVLQGGMVLIFGLVLACPLLVVGLMRLGRGIWNTADHRFYATTLALFFGAVVATQYRYGGGAEWGGRYFAVGLPFAIALAIPGLDLAVRTLPGARIRRLVVLAVLPAIMLNLAGLYGIRESRIRTAALVDTVAEVTATLRLRTASVNDESAMAQPGATDRPIVITTVPAAGRLSWSELDNARWLLVDKGELEPVASRLFDLGVRNWVLLSTDLDEELAEIRRFYQAETWESSDDVPADVVIVAAVDDR